MASDTVAAPGCRHTLTGADRNTVVLDIYGSSDAPVAILLHGGGQSRSSWAIAAQRLGEAGYRACAVDVRGHGESDWPTNGDYSLDRFVEDLLRVMEALGPPAVLIGASYGGHVALATAARRPEHVRALVLCDVTPWIEGEATKSIRRRMLEAESGFASLEDAAAHLDAIGGGRSGGAFGYLPEHMRRWPDGRFHWHWDPRFFRTYEVSGDRLTEAVSTAAKALTVPTLLIHAEHSEIVSERQVLDFQTLVPHAVVAQIPGARHTVRKSDNEAYAAIILDFLRATSGRGQSARDQSASARNGANWP